MKTLNQYILKNEATTINEGLEKINKISLLEDNTIIIEYEITKEYQEKNELVYKHRILKLSVDSPRNIEDYANIMEV